MCALRSVCVSKRDLPTCVLVWVREERWNDDHFVCHISLRWYRQASVLPDTALEDRYCRASSQGPQPPSRADDYSHTEMQRTDLHDERNREAPKTWPSLSEPFTRLFLQPLVSSPLAFRLARCTRLQRSGRFQICRVVVGEIQVGRAAQDVD